MSGYPEQDIALLQKDIEGILPEDAISVSMVERINNAVDPTVGDIDISSVPYMVVAPDSAKQVSELLKYANAKMVPLFIRGAGTSFTGASRYKFKGIVLNTRRLNHFDLLSKYGFVELGPGLRVLDIADRLAESGYFFPVVPGSRKVSTIGGAITNNTSAHLVDSFAGKPADYVLGLQVVLPTGEIIETGTKGLRKPAGTDLTKLFVGGDGLLGVITNIRMRLVPDYEYAYSVSFYKDSESAARAVQQVYYDKAPLPLFWEFLDHNCAVISFRYQGLETPPGPVLLAQMTGRTKQEALQKVSEFNASLKKINPKDLRKIEDQEEWEKIWTAREVIFAFLCQESDGTLCGGSEIVGNLPGLIDCISDCANFADGIPVLQELQTYVQGHIGSLAFHPTYILPNKWPAEKKGEAYKEVVKKSAHLNIKYQTCGGEWGTFANLNYFYLNRYGEKVYQLVKEMKKLFDPNNILNPGLLLDN